MGRGLATRGVRRMPRARRRLPQRARGVRAALLCALLAGSARADVAETFPTPSNLRSAVAFWKRIFTEVDTRAGLLHDTQDLARVYEVVSLPETPSDQDAHVRARRERLQALLVELGAGRRTPTSTEEQRLLALFPPNVSPDVLAAASQRVRFQRGQADRFRAGLERKGRWEAHILRVLSERGLPAEIAALPHVESSFDPMARSSAGASGLWQFTRTTGRLFLRIDGVVDERNDPQLSSTAAAQLLAENYRKTGTWPLAITAYNHGANGMLRAIQQLGTNDIGEIVARYESPTFGFASRNFYAEFLAALEIDREPTRYFGPIARAPADQPVTVTLERAYPARAVASAFGVSLDALRSANPALLDAVWSGRHAIPAGFRLRVPGDPGAAAIARVLATIASPARAGTAADGPDRYTVRPGDSLSRIARRLGTSEAELAAANGIANPDRLVAGTVLRIRRHSSSAAASYAVRKGDTLYAIARSFGVGVEALVAANDLSDHHRIFPGQRLSVPSSTELVGAAR